MHLGAERPASPELELRGGLHALGMKAKCEVHSRPSRGGASQCVWG